VESAAFLWSRVIEALYHLIVNKIADIRRRLYRYCIDQEGLRALSMSSVQSGVANPGKAEV
jgi:hypothetical protein